MAKQEINMPRFGASMKKGTVTDWEVSVGDTVKKGDTLLSIDAEKSAADIESLYDGTVVEITAEVGEEYDVGAILGYIEEA